MISRRTEGGAGAGSETRPESGGGSRLAEWLTALVAVAVLFVLYAFTAPRSVIFEDDGLFIMAAVDAGVAHPPGYPLYTILGYLFSFLSIIDPPAFRIHLLSGLLGAAACGLLFMVARAAGMPRLFALVTALAYGVSEHFWSQTIIAEVYSLNVLLSLAVLLLCMQAAAQPVQRTKKAAKRSLRQGRPNRSPLEGEPERQGRSPPPSRWGVIAKTFSKDGSWPRQPLLWAAFCFGLGLANHWPLMVLAAPAFAVLLFPHLRSWRFSVLMTRLTALAGVALATALTLYLWMVWRSFQPGIIAFYGPIDSISDFWYYISRQGYGGVDSSPSAGIVDKLGFAGYFSKQVLFQYTVPGVLLAALGIDYLYRQGRGLLLIATIWIFLAHSLLLILALGFDYEFLNEAVFRPYPLVSYGILALWMGCGLCFVWDKFPLKGGAIIQALALVIPLYMLLQNLPVNDRSDDDFADRYGRMLLQGLEPEAVLFVVGDTTTAPLGYLHYIEGLRPDVLLINTQGLVYPSRLFVPPTTSSRRARAFSAFMEGNSGRRPVYTINANDDIPNPNGTVHYGFYQKVDPAGEPSSITLLFDREVVDYFRSIVSGPLPEDRWNRHQHSILLQQFGNFLGYTAMSADPVLRRTAAELVEAMQNQYYGLVDMAEILIEHGYNAEHLQTAQELLNRAEPLQDETLSKDMRGRHHYRRGFLNYRLGRMDDAVREFRLSIEANDHPDNPSRQGLSLLEGPP